MLTAVCIASSGDAFARSTLQSHLHEHNFALPCEFPLSAVVFYAYGYVLLNVFGAWVVRLHHGEYRSRFSANMNPLSIRGALLKWV